MRHSTLHLCGTTLALCLLYSAAMARQIKLTNTAQPDATSIQDLVASVTKGCRTDQEKMIALWAYLARNGFYHWAEAREKPEETTELGLVYDPIIAFNVHGTLICYQVADLLGNLADQAGIKPRHLQVPGHRVMEAFYDNAWHFYDATYDCAAYFRSDDGKNVISLEELCRDAAKYLRNPKCQSDPCYQFDKYGGKFWPWESKQFVIEKMFTPDTPAKADHYSTKIARGHTMGLDLRRGEKLVLNWTNEGKWYCSAALYKQWSQDKTQKWLDQGPHDPRNPRLKYANGLLVYQPDWSNPRNFADGVYESRNVQLKDGRVQSSTGSDGGLVVFGVRTPYLIAGKPGKLDADGDSTDGAILEAELFRKDAAAGLMVEISTDNGLTWKQVWYNQKTGTVPVKLDLTNHVEGTYGYLVRFKLSGPDGAASMGKLKLTTSLFMSAVPLPGVRSSTGSDRPERALGHSGANEFAFSCREGEGLLTIRTDMSDEQACRRHFKELVNLTYGTAFPSHLTPVRADQPAYAVMEVAPPEGEKIQFLTVYASFGGRPKGADQGATEILHAADPAGPWQSAWKSDWSDRNYHWRWDRSTEIRLKAPAGKCYLKFLLGADPPISLNMARVYAHTVRAPLPLPPGAVRITHAWLEDGQPKTQTVQPAVAGAKYKIQAGGKEIVNQSVTIDLANEK